MFNFNLNTNHVKEESCLVSKQNTFHECLFINSWHDVWSRFPSGTVNESSSLYTWLFSSVRTRVALSLHSDKVVSGDPTFPSRKKINVYLSTKCKLDRLSEGPKHLGNGHNSTIQNQPINREFSTFKLLHRFILSDQENLEVSRDSSTIFKIKFVQIEYSSLYLAPFYHNERKIVKQNFCFYEKIFNSDFGDYIGNSTNDWTRQWQVVPPFLQGSKTNEYTTTDSSLPLSQTTCVCVIRWRGSLQYTFWAPNHQPQDWTKNGRPISRPKTSYIHQYIRECRQPSQPKELK